MQRQRQRHDWSNVTMSLEEVHRQVGDLRINDVGLATRGLLVRHLVMPNHVENTKRVVEYLAEEASENTFVDIMAQYRITRPKPRTSTGKSADRSPGRSTRKW